MAEADYIQKYVDSDYTQDITAMGEKLTAAGYQVSPIIQPNPETKFRFVNDPDGYQVQLVER